MDEQSARVRLHLRERSFKRLQLARFGETVTCVYCESTYWTYEAITKKPPAVVTGQLLEADFSLAGFLCLREFYPADSVLTGGFRLVDIN